MKKCTTKIKNIRFVLLSLVSAVVFTANCSGFLDVPNEAGIDTPKVATSTQDGKITVHENDKIKIYYKLNKRPTRPVTVTLNLGGNAGQATIVGSRTLTFTPDNWRENQEIVIQGVKDNVADGNKAISVYFDPIVSDDPSFKGYIPPELQITVIDIDSPGVTLDKHDIRTNEDGLTQEVRVVLNSKPTSDVTVTMTVPKVHVGESSERYEGEIKTSSGSYGNSVTLTFTPANWNASQVVTVKGLNDSLNDKAQEYKITSTATSADSNYNNISISDISVTNMDNDSPAISVTSLGGSVKEQGETSRSFTVTLDGGRPLPGEDVVISLTNPFPSRLKLLDTNGNPITQLTFTHDNTASSTSQTVTVKAIEDSFDNGDQTGTIVLALTSGNYNNVDPNDVSVTIIDNDTAGVDVGSTIPTLDETGKEASFNVALKTKPTSNVRVNIIEDVTKNENCHEGKVISTATLQTTNINSCSSSGTVTKWLVFTPSNWNVAQTIRLKGQADDIVDPDQQYGLKLKIDSSTTDAVYKALAATTRTINNNNINFLGIWITAYNKVDGTTSTIKSTDTQITVSGFATDDMNHLDSNVYSKFSLHLGSKPAGNVNIALNIPSTSPNQHGVFNSNGGISKTLTFTTSTWNTPQWVVVNGASNNANEGNQDYLITSTITGADSDYNNTSKVQRPRFQVRSCDNDASNLIVACRRSGFFGTSEGGGKAKLWYITKSSPSANVQVPVTSSDLTEGTISKTPAVINASNWNTMTAAGSNYVEAAGVDDAVFDGNVAYNIVPGAATGALTYTAPAEAIRNVDNEKLLILTKVSDASENDTAGNGTGTFNIKMNGSTAPSPNLKISISCGPAAECLELKCNGAAGCAQGSNATTLDLTFTDLNNKLLKVTGKNDNKVDGPKGISISFTTPVTTDPNFQNIPAPPTESPIQNIDNDKLIWFTKNYGGALGVTSFAQLDAKCNRSDPNAPTGAFKPYDASDSQGTHYKALMAYNGGSSATNRVATTTGSNATGQENWVLQANTEYYKGFTTKVFKSNANKLINFPLSTNLSSSQDFWTGLNANMTSGSNCNNWADEVASGHYGTRSQTSSSAIGGTSGACSNGSTHRSIICVQQ